MACNLSNPQLFLDDRWVEHSHHLERRWYEATIFPEPVLRPTEPWEGYQVIMSGTVMKDMGFDGFRMYYCVYSPPLQRAMCMAESDDGIHWRKPKLGLYEFDGSRQNNIVYRTETRNDAARIAYDPDAEYPYRMYYFEWPRQKVPGVNGYIRVAHSRDGIHFEEVPEPALSTTGDRNNILLTKVGGKWFLLCRHKDMRRHPGSRSIWLSESDDGYQFTEPELILYPDLADPALAEYYGMAAFPYGDLYVGLLEYWYNHPDRIDIMLAWSNDLKTWSRPPKRQMFIKPAFPWNAKWNSPANSPPIEVGNQLWFYFGGRSGAHGFAPPNSYGVIGLAALTRDRFCSISADARPGVLITKPMLWPGGDLLINASATRYADSHPFAGGGEMSVEVLDAEQRTVEGYSGENAAFFAGNVPTRSATEPSPIRWGEQGLDALKGETVRLRFTMRDARLFSFKAG